MKILVAALCALAAFAADPPKTVMVLKAARMFDGKGDSAVSPGLIVVRAGRIEGVGASAKIPADAEVIDLGNGTLLPGFIDAHTHLSDDYSNNYNLAALNAMKKSTAELALDMVPVALRTLMAGFTTVRDVGGAEYIDVAMRNAIRDGKITGPRMLVATHAIGATGGHCDDQGGYRFGIFGHESGIAEGVANGPYEMRAAVRLNIKYGADVIKTCATGGVLSLTDDVDTPQLTQAELDALVDESHALRRKTAAHAHGAEGIKRAVRAGIDSIEHGTFADDEALSMMKAKGTVLIPTMMAAQGLRERLEADANFPQAVAVKARAAIAALDGMVNRAIRMGVKVGLGTDAVVYPHGRNAEEFHLLVEHGMTPAQALKAGTMVDAELLGIAAQTGSLETGKSADIVAVPGNPLENIRQTEHVVFVMREGVVYKNARVLIFLTAAVVLAADPTAERLAKRATGDTPMMKDLRELCDSIGGRPTGSAACDRAVEWGVKKFRDAGLTSVRTEGFRLPRLWLGETAQADAVSPAKFAVRLAAAPFTPSVKVEAAVVDVGEGSPEEFATAGAKARGAILLVHSKEMKTFDDLFAEYMKSGGLMESAKKAGAVALLLESTRPRGLLYRHPMTFGTMAPLPAAVIAREAAERLGRLAGEGAVRLRLDIRNRVGDSYEAKNVVAEIRGREKPDEIVLIGAHLDSWDLGTGAEDNGVNCALVLDVARAFKELGIQPRRTVRFVLYTGEEQGMWGSAGYVATHRTELDKHAAVVIFDTGSGKTTGFYLNGREELRAPVNAALGAAGLSITEHLGDALDGTDNFDFLLSGVPNLVAIQDPLPYLPDYHAESDVFERSNEKEQKASAAVAAALVYGLAEAPDRPAQRQSRTEVEKLLIDTKLDAQMKAFGQWDDWIAKKRGLF